MTRESFKIYLGCRHQTPVDRAVIEFLRGFFEGAIRRIPTHVYAIWGLTSKKYVDIAIWN